MSKYGIYKFWLAALALCTYGKYLLKKTWVTDKHSITYAVTTSSAYQTTVLLVLSVHTVKHKAWACMHVTKIWQKQVHQTLPKGYTRSKNQLHQTAPKQSTPDCPKTVHQTLKNRHTWPKNCLMIASSNEPKILWVRFGIHVCIMNTIITWKPDWKCPHYHLLCF